MKLDQGYELILGIFFVGLTFSYLGFGIYNVLIAAVALAAGLLLVKGFIEYFANGSLDNFWIGACMTVVLALFFGGLGMVIKVVAGIAAFALGLAHGVLGALA